jgi:ribosomal-protein-alanine N-acetyltransferase
MKAAGKRFAAGDHCAPFLPLSTPRMTLAALTLEHAAAIFAYASDPAISRLVAWRRHESLEDSRLFVARSMVGYEKGNEYEWGLIRRSDQAFLGTCGLGAIDIGRGAGELSYVLAKPYWGRGYATEAAAAALEFGFARLGLCLIEAHAFLENAASMRVLAKLGLSCGETRLVRDPMMSMSRPVTIWQLGHEQWAGRSDAYPVVGQPLRPGKPRDAGD